MLIHTDTVDIELNLGAQELVPFVDGMDQIATTIEGASAAKGMREGCIGCKVGIDRFSLLREVEVSNMSQEMVFNGLIPVRQVSPGTACVQRR
jgi:hypothetical protein